MSEKIAKALLPINCFYNYEIEVDGKCHNTNCMLNEVPELAGRILIDGVKLGFNITISKSQIANIIHRRSWKNVK